MVRSFLAGAAALAFLASPALADDVILYNTPTVQNAAYSASNAIGGWQGFPIFKPGPYPSAVIDYVSVSSKGGSTTAITIYAFARSSSGLASTCTDKSAFSLSASDIPYLIPGFPVALTPATAQGSTASFASQAIVVSAKSMDASPNTNISICAVVGGSVTPASTSDLIFSVAANRG